MFEPRRPIIVAFSGKRGSGKTTAAKFLESNYGFTRASFAGTLKALANTIFPFTVADFTEKNKEIPYAQYSWTPREFLITLGKFLRYYDQDYFVKKVRLESKTVIDDLRFNNELAYLKNKGAFIIRMERFKYLNVYKDDLEDSSETELDNAEFDYEIPACRNTDFETLHKQLSLIMKSIMYKK